MNFKISSKFASLFFSAAVLIFAVSFIAYAWTEPGSIPPTGNVDAPINTGSANQVKSGRFGIGSSVDANYLFTVGTSQGAKITNIGVQPTLYVEDEASDATPFVIAADGNVGIGTASPDAKLVIAGQIKITGGTPGVNRALVSDASGLASWQSISSVGFPLLAPDGTAAAPSYAFANNANLGIFRPAANVLGFSTGGVERMRLDASGNVGIGITAPASTLALRRSAAGTVFSVRNTGDTTNTFTISDAGAAYMTGFQLGTSATAGHVLTVNASGIGTWQAIPGLSWPLLSTIDGTAAAPAYSWSLDTNMGIRRGGVDDLRFVTNGADRIMINSSGQVGVGTTTIRDTLTLGGNIVPATANTGQLGTATYHWNQVNANAYYYRSDESLKTNIRPINNSLDKISSLSGIYFNWKNSGEQSIGILAQEVEKFFPEAVAIDKETGIKSVDYAKLTAPLIESIKAQQKQIEELKLEIEDLKLKIR